MSATILGRARWLFSVMAVTVFSALVLVGCGEKDDDGGNIVCADGEAWVATIEGERLGFIPKANGDFVVIAHVPELNGWFGDVVGRWSTRGNNITLYVGEEPETGTYNVSGNSATITVFGETIPLTKQSGIRYELGYDIHLPWEDIVVEVGDGGGAGGVPSGGVPTPTKTTFTDSRDSKTYKKVTIGTQTWMAENLDYNVGGSVCYENSASNCAKYGRLYDREAAMKACPSGWHLPSGAEWRTLQNYVYIRDGRELKSTAGWDGSGNGTDEYGFSALPGGVGYSDGSFGIAGYYGIWWSATEYDATDALGRGMYFSDGRIRIDDNEAGLFSVRCVQD